MSAVASAVQPSAIATSPSQSPGVRLSGSVRLVDHVPPTPTGAVTPGSSRVLSETLRSVRTTSVPSVPLPDTVMVSPAEAAPVLSPTPLGV